MKKQYLEVEIEVITLMTNDVITVSDHGYDPEGMFDENSNNDRWDW